MEFDNDTSTTKSWIGSSISDICKGKGPWTFNVSPVNASKYHAVLYKLPVTLNAPPVPYSPFQPRHWDEDHVLMPYSEKNLFPVNENGIDVIKLRWNVIKQNLSNPIRNSRELEEAISTYKSSLPKFLALHYFFEEVLSVEESEYFFDVLLPKIIRLALRLPEILPGGLPILKRNRNRSVSLSQLQISCLLANAFLCTFPLKKDIGNLCPGVNFARLYASHSKPNRLNPVAEKLKCLMHYFRRVTEKTPNGVVTFERKFIPKDSMPRWDVFDNNLGNIKIHINSTGTIEDDGAGFLQVDFANKNVGGGVLGYGCVQEEIRFVISPELLISRLIVEQLGNQEAVIVTGPERYSKYSGYSETFAWTGNVMDSTPYDEYGRRRTAICIIDATHFWRPQEQFNSSAILRELNKAYVGFSSREKENLAPVATGNWGCGAFQGNPALKSLIQLMACSAAGRDMVYFSFGDKQLLDQLYNMYIFLANNRISIAQLWKILCGFASLKLPEDKLYAYVQQAFFDRRKQPSIKKFFGIGTRKKESEIPSTSSDYRAVYKRKEPLDIDIMEYLNDDDLSPVSPSEPPRKEISVRMKDSNEDITKKLPKTDIAELIDIIDGNSIKPKAKHQEDSFLAEIEKLRKNSNRNDIEGGNLLHVEEGEKMEITESVSGAVTVLNSPTSEAKTSKKKITDYFQIRASKSS